MMSIIMLAEYLQRKNMSITKKSLHDLAPFLKQYNGNFSMAMREVIDFTLFTLDNCGSISRAKELIISQNNSDDLRPDDQVIMQVVKVIRRRK
jgi:hypothetical protein